MPAPPLVVPLRTRNMYGPDILTVVVPVIVHVLTFLVPVLSTVALKEAVTVFML